VYVVLAKHGFTRYSPVLRNAMLETDVEANAFLGNNSLLDVLKRIDQFGFEDIEKMKRRPKSGRPSTAQRIENLAAASIQ
jgi:hypothetical protein